MKSVIFLSAFSATAHAYWLMGVGTLFDTPQRLDPIISPDGIASHAHKVLGGSNFGPSVSTAELRESECTTTPVKEDHSSYWVPNMYFEWANGSFTDVTGGAVIYYLFNDTVGATTPFPDDFRMISGNPNLRSYDASSYAQQAVTFLCLDYTPGSSTSRHNEIPTISCPDGIRAQLNFPSCWDGKNADSSDHKSHVAFRSEGPDTGDCLDPDFPVSIPRIFIEIYWGTQDFTAHFSEAKNPGQPFVLSNGDATGYGHHGDFINGWETATLQKAVDGCNCNIYGDPQCCADAGIFTLDTKSTCQKTNMVDERTTGMLSKLPGNNPVTGEGATAVPVAAATVPGFVTPVKVYTDGVYPSGDYSSSGSTTVDASSSAAEPDSSSTAADTASSSAAAESATSTGAVLVAKPTTTKEAASTAAAASSTEAAASSTKDASAASSEAVEATSTAAAAEPSASDASDEDDDEDEDCSASNDTHHHAHKHHHSSHHSGRSTERARREAERARRAHRRHTDYSMNTF